MVDDTGMEIPDDLPADRRGILRWMRDEAREWVEELGDGILTSESRERTLLRLTAVLCAEELDRVEVVRASANEFLTCPQCHSRYSLALWREDGTIDVDY